MQQKSDIHVFQGMQRDMDPHKQKPEFLVDARNIRITNRGEDTNFAITSEKSTEQIILEIPLSGYYLGHTVLGNYVVLFTTKDSEDTIYRLQKIEDTFKVDILYRGSLNFNIEYPIESFGYFENENIQKVYWTDGVNQPRVINIVKDKLDEVPVETVRARYNNDSFNFSNELDLKESVKVSKESNASGMFPAGCIQYALSYYNKYGQESNLAYVTPIYYTSFNDRAGSPEESISNAFRINIDNADSHFEYLRLYSIFRTSLDTVPTVKMVTDIPLKYSVLNSNNPFVTMEIPYNKEYGLIHFNDLNSVYIEDTKGIRPITTKEKGEIPNQLFSFWRQEPITQSGYIFEYDKNLRIHITENIEKVYSFDSRAGKDNVLYLSDVEFNNITGSGKILIPLKKNDDGTYETVSNNRVMKMEVSTQAHKSQISILDTNTSGSIVDPSMLLYIGGEEISAKTFTHKDGTLFLGNINIKRPQIPENIKKTFKGLQLKENTREFKILDDWDSSFYQRADTLNTKDINNNLLSPLTFKSGELYRFGFQLQYKNGKWSEPIYINDYRFVGHNNGDKLLTANIKLDLKNPIFNGYKKARGVVVLPGAHEREILAQGVLCPTVYNLQERFNNGYPYAQSSWFTRLFPRSSEQFSYSTKDNETTIDRGSFIEYRDNYTLRSFADRGSEIQGVPGEFSSRAVSTIIPDEETKINRGTELTYKVNHKSLSSVFAVDQSILTMHSPDIEWDDSFFHYDYNQLKFRIIGICPFQQSAGDINIQTSSPQISSKATGFIHRSTRDDQTAKTFASGLLYEDYLVDDYKDIEPVTFGAYREENVPFLYMVYPWQKSGSLNNDMIRPSDGGTRSAVLKRKVLSNVKVSNTDIRWGEGNFKTYNAKMALFSSDDMDAVKLGDKVYYGNVDTLLTAVCPYGPVFSVGYQDTASDDTVTFHYKYDNDNSKVPSYYDTVDNFASLKDKGGFTISEYGNFLRNIDTEKHELGDAFDNVTTSRESIRMRYKSTPHIAISLLQDGSSSERRPILNSANCDYPYLYVGEIYRKVEDKFGNPESSEADANLWIPAGEPANIIDGETTIEFKYGDTYYQRYDCLKTYSFTDNDENSIIDIISFMVESRVNCDGRYDRNRGQLSNLYMSPRNFNLHNSVYSQSDNFFNYRILDKDYYKLSSFPNSFTWSLQKNNAEDTDRWTTVTLASIAEVNGEKGEISKIESYKDTLYCFQERGISAIMFNSRVQVPTSDGVPIEISNNYKVDGTRYITDNIGCSNKWSLTKTPSGIYFIDPNSKDLYHIGDDGLNNISGTHGLSNWFKHQDSISWTISEGIRCFYDYNNNDLYIKSKEECLNYSELLGQFVSFHDYQSANALFNVGDSFYAFDSYNDGTVENRLWKMFSSNTPTNIFNEPKYQSITFYSNENSAMDKIFTNMEITADWKDYSNLADGTGTTEDFFDTLEVSNEYQTTGPVPIKFIKDRPSNLKKKFRIWRVKIPRDSRHKRDRIRNHWAKISLTNTSSTMPFILHDLSVQYYM